MKNRVFLIILMLVVWFLVLWLLPRHASPAEGTICVLEEKTISKEANLPVVVKRVCIDGYEFVVSIYAARGIAISPSFKGLGLKKCTCEKPKTTSK